MNVACPSCPAKYAVPDEKVRGKKARITCKRCGSAIIIDGTAVTQASKPPAKPRAEPLPPPPVAFEEPPAAVEEWLVAITDDNQQPATVERIVSLYASGAIDAETFLWKEGMAEWQTPFEIPEIAEALQARGLQHRVLEPGVENVPETAPTYDDDEATHIGRPLAVGAQNPSVGGGWTEPGRWGGMTANESQPYDDELTIARDSSPHSNRYPVGEEDSSDEDRTIAREPSPSVPAPLPAAGRPPDSSPSPGRSSRSSIPGELSENRRRYVRPAHSERPAAATAARRAAADISARPERAVADLFGGQAAAGGEMDESLGRSDSNPPDASGARLTGQRNESSVLFSLDALIKAESSPPESRRSSRPAAREAELLLGNAGPSSIAGLGGDFNALVAPDLMAPARGVPEPLPRAAYGDDYVPPPPARGRFVKVLLLVLFALGAGAAGAMFLPKLLNPPPLPLQPNATPTEKTAAAPTATETAPPATEPAPTATEAASASASAPPTGVAAKHEAPSAPRAPSERAAPKPAEPEPAATAEKGLAEAMGEGTTAPFDPAAAKAALTSAANSAASCKQEGGPTGTGRALVTFAASGRVTKAEITGDFAGTGVGGCVARLFRAARVPKFSGEPTTVSKNFTIQ